MWSESLAGVIFLQSGCAGTWCKWAQHIKHIFCIKVVTDSFQELGFYNLARWTSRSILSTSWNKLQPCSVAYLFLCIILAHIFKICNLVTEKVGCAIAQVVSHRLPRAAAWVQAQAKSCGICGGQSGTGAGFLQVHRFPLPILIPPTVPHSSSSIIWGWYSRPMYQVDSISPHSKKLTKLLRKLRLVFTLV
jgi:hypothetical protein